jgi:hypothetical protein
MSVWGYIITQKEAEILSPAQGGVQMMWRNRFCFIVTAFTLKQVTMTLQGNVHEMPGILICHPVPSLIL